MANNTLQDARRAKKDEFYTRLEDIEREMMHYTAHFRGATVLLNCDDPYESNFFQHFCLKFNDYGLKRLIATCYAGSTVAGREMPILEQALGLDFGDEAEETPQDEPADSTADREDSRSSKRQLKAYCVVIDHMEDYNHDGHIDEHDIPEMLRLFPPTILHGDEQYGAGDFRSRECVEYLRQADIVVTNPPFSLFREFVALLEEHKKKYIIVGNQNAITYKEIFPLIKENKMWLGYGFPGLATYFINTKYEDYAASSVHKEGMIRVSGVVWFTNLEIDKRHEPFTFIKHYDPALYPHYDNYDAIEVSKTADIPDDYYGVMGVPITYLGKHCPDQFEIIWTTDRGGDGMIEDLKKPHKRFDAPVMNGKGIYKRLFIRRIPDAK